MNYDIVQAPNINNLISKVKDKIKEEWKPIGGVSVVDASLGGVKKLTFIQAIIQE